MMEAMRVKKRRGGLRQMQEGMEEEKEMKGFGILQRLGFRREFAHFNSFLNFIYTSYMARENQYLITKILCKFGKLWNKVKPE